MEKNLNSFLRLFYRFQKEGKKKKKAIYLENESWGRKVWPE